ncbi:MAG: hypothetical protein M3Y49_06090 [Actinomycetota bacterium]|nr:hypothetical protein [Actinomycetota bacterium]
MSTPHHPTATNQIKHTGQEARIDVRSAVGDFDDFAAVVVMQCPDAGYG